MEEAKMNGKAQVGDKAPDFTLPTQAGEQVSLHDFVGKKALVLYFYPKDNTPGCTAEAWAFRDQYEVFKEAGAEVIGVSSDTFDSHKSFAQQHKLPFVLLSDNTGEVRKLYGASSLGILPGRVTYVIDQEGIIRHVFSSQFAPEKHINEALKIIRGLANN